MSTIAELRALLAKATQGPWVARVGTDGAVLKVPLCGHVSVAWFGSASSVGVDGAYRVDGAEANGNAALAATAINALPALLDVAEAAQRYFAARKGMLEDEAPGALHDLVRSEDDMEAALKRLEVSDEAG